MDDISKLVGASVNFVRLGSQIDINFINPAANLQIEAPFQLETGDGSATIDPSDIDSLAPLLKILHATVFEIELGKDYSLSLVFGNGIKVVVKPVQKYEAWNLTGDDLPHLVASPLQANLG